MRHGRPCCSSTVFLVLGNPGQRKGGVGVERTKSSSGPTPTGLAAQTAQGRGPHCWDRLWGMGSQAGQGVVPAVPYTTRWLPEPPTPAALLGTGLPCPQTWMSAASSVSALGAPHSQRPGSQTRCVCVSPSSEAQGQPPWAVFGMHTGHPSGRRHSPAPPQGQAHGRWQCQWH